jgi:ABC-2 type transport system permease protein
VTNTIRSESRKLTATRTTRVTVALALAAAPILTVINSYAAGRNGQAGLDTTAGIHHVFNAGVLVAMVMLALGIHAVACEHRFATIIPTLLAEPRRLRVLFAKAGVLGAAGAAVAAASFGLAVAVAIPSLAIHGVHRLPADLLLMFAGAITEGALFGVIGVALGAITRSTVTAIVAAVAWVGVIESVVLHNIAPSVAKWLPSGVAMAVDRTTDTRNLLAPPVAAAVLLTYAAALIVAAARLTSERDAL